MSDDGHAIGLPAGEPYRPGHSQPDEPGPAQPYAPTQPYTPTQPGPYRDPYPPGELDDLVAAHAQGRQLAEAGDLTAARTLLEEALQRGELRFGAEDARLAPLMVDLATIARRLGNLTEAHNQLHHAYTIIVASAGAEHATSLSIEGRLAAVSHRLGEPTDAYDHHLADAGARVLGDEHPAVQGARQRLASQTQAPPSLAAAAPFPPVTEPTAAFAPPAEPYPATAPYPTAAPAPAFAPPAEPAPAYALPVEPAPAYALPVEPAPAYALPGEPAPAFAPLVETRQPAPRALPAVALSPAEAGGTYAPVAEGIYQRVEPGSSGGWNDDVTASEEPTVRRRSAPNAGVILVASLCAVVLIGGVLVALQLLRPDGGPTVPDPVTQPETTPAVSASAAPTGVTIRDDGGSVTITWIDPSGGAVQFLVSGARAGNALVVLTSVPAGRTTATIYGLNANYNYCFSVSAVWSADNIQESMRTCTSRRLPSGTQPAKTST